MFNDQNHDKIKMQDVDLQILFKDFLQSISGLDFIRKGCPNGGIIKIKTFELMV